MPDVVIVTPPSNPPIIVGASSIGPQGLVGPAGGTYVHTQNTASSAWTITHNLGCKPNCTALDSAGSVVEGTPSWPSNNVMTLTFSAAFAGVAYLS